MNSKDISRKNRLSSILFVGLIFSLVLLSIGLSVLIFNYVDNLMLQLLFSAISFVVLISIYEVVGTSILDVVKKNLD